MNKVIHSFSSPTSDVSLYSHYLIGLRKKQYYIKNVWLLRFYLSTRHKTTLFWIVSCVIFIELVISMNDFLKDPCNTIIIILFSTLYLFPQESKTKWLLQKLQTEWLIIWLVIDFSDRETHKIFTVLHCSFICGIKFWSQLRKENRRWENTPVHSIISRISFSWQYDFMIKHYATLSFQDWAYSWSLMLLNVSS